MGKGVGVLAELRVNLCPFGEMEPGTLGAYERRGGTAATSKANNELRKPYCSETRIFRSRRWGDMRCFDRLPC